MISDRFCSVAKFKLCQAPSSYIVDKQLRCFNSIFGKLDVTTLGQRAEIRLPGPLTGKRARINCTMPGPDGRWRWYGRQFLLPTNP